MERIDLIQTINHAIDALKHKCCAVNRCNKWNHAGFLCRTMSDRSNSQQALIIL